MRPFFDYLQFAGDPARDVQLLNNLRPSRHTTQAWLSPLAARFGRSAAIMNVAPTNKAGWHLM
jgi:hypothetical protein